MLQNHSRAQKFFPPSKQFRRCLQIPKIIFRDLSEAFLVGQLFHVQSGYAMRFRTFNAEGFAGESVESDDYIGHFRINHPIGDRILQNCSHTQKLFPSSK
jgi:hypothetical protein